MSYAAVVTIKLRMLLNNADGCWSPAFLGIRNLLTVAITINFAISIKFFC